MALPRRFFALHLALAACALAAWAAAPAGATTPASYYNSDEHHDSNTEECATLKMSASLRYANFTPTGFTTLFSTGECSNSNSILLDKRDLWNTCNDPDVSPCGRIYFHRGGVNASDEGNDKYGHIWIGDLVSPAPSQTSFRYPGHNGDACATSTDPDTQGNFEFVIADMPNAMKYKPDDSAKFRKYADTWYQGTQQGRGIHYGYLTWNWLNNIENPGISGEYIHGGGVVRSLMRDGQVFHRCDVTTLTMNSVDANGTVNGRVQAIYGKTHPANNWIYGWIMYTHKAYFGYTDQGTGQFVPANTTVYHVRSI
jgi:hypothetical protein